MKMRMRYALAVLTVLMAVEVSEANLIVNGGFETGGLPPWEVRWGQASVESAGFMGLFSPYEGGSMGVLSPDTYKDSALVQFGTGTGDEPLRLSFWYNLVASNASSSIEFDIAKVLFNGVILGTAELVDLPGGPYTATGWQYFDEVVTPASAGTFELTFTLWNTYAAPCQGAMVLLDDVRLTTVPDGGATGSMLAGVLVGAMLCAGAARRRNA